MSGLKGKIPLATAASFLVTLVALVWAAHLGNWDTGGPPSPNGELALTAEPTPAPALVTPPGTETAPEFQGILRWLNGRPLTLAEARGQVVLIDFWTYS